VKIECSRWAAFFVKTVGRCPQNLLISWLISWRPVGAVSPALGARGGGREREGEIELALSRLGRVLTAQCRQTQLVTLVLLRWIRNNGSSRRTLKCQLAKDFPLASPTLSGTKSRLDTSGGSVRFDFHF